MFVKAKKGLAFLLALVLVLCMVPASVFADEVTVLPYDGDDLGFFKADLETAFGMLTPQAGTTCEIDGDNVVIHIVPKNTTVYNALHWGAITDEELTPDVPFNADGTIDLTLPKDEYCGFAHPIAPIKASDGGTSSAQYYLAIPAEEKLPHALQKIPYDGNSLGFYKEDLQTAFGMLTPQTGSTCEIDGNDVVIHIIPKNTTVYNALHWGAITDDPLTPDVPFNTDGTIDLTLPKAEYCGYAHPIAPIKASDGGTSSAQYYLAIPSEDKLSHVVRDIELSITNNTGMFKAVTAHVHIAADGSQTLIFALSGSGYEYLFKGTYEEACANGDNRENWIHGELNEAGKLEFAMPLEEGETYIPVVAISKSYLDKYEQGLNPLERAFYPRQMEVDLAAATLVTGDYCRTDDLTIVNNVSMFRPASATLTTVGGPNSNNYGTTLDLLYGTDSYDQAFIGRASEAESGNVEIISAEDRHFLFPLRWIVTAGQPDTVVNLMEEPFIVSFHSANNGNWYERQFTVDEEALTVTFDPAPPEEQDIELSITNNTGMFKAVTAHVHIASDGSRTLIFALSGTGYRYVFKGTYEEAVANGDNRENWIGSVENADGKLEFTMPLEDGETYIPVVAISQSYLDKYEQGLNPLERAFYPRQMELDLAEATLVTGDYCRTDELEIINNVSMFRPASATLTTVGGPNSNNYGTTLDLLYGTDSYDQAFIGRASEAGSGNVEIIEADERHFLFPLRWIVTAGQPDTVVNLMEEPFIVSFRSANNGNWYERQFTVDEAGLTITFDPAPVEFELQAALVSGGVKLTYDDAPGAEVYEIFRKTGDGEFEKIGETTEKTYKDTSVDVQTTYQYKVTGANGVSNEAEITTGRFLDVLPGDSWNTAVNWAVENGIVNGTSATTFSPKAACTRAQFALMLYRLAGKPAVDMSTNPFTDLPNNNGIKRAIVWAYNEGIVNGTSATTFSPEKNITRAQLTLMLYKMAGKPSVDGLTCPFEDLEGLTGNNLKAIIWAYNNNIVKGTGATTFSPKANCTRGQLVIMLYRFNRLQGYLPTAAPAAGAEARIGSYLAA